jgi:UDP-glucose 4-epimerase
LHLTDNQVNKMFSENAFDAVMHFAAVAYVGESTQEPLRYNFFNSGQLACQSPLLFEYNYQI